MSICFSICCLFYLFLDHNKVATALSYLTPSDWFGFQPSHIFSSFLLVFNLIISLYLGEIVYTIMKIYIQHKKEKLTYKQYKCVYILYLRIMIQFPWYVYISGHSHIALRNYILGPISEEFYFRCCMVSLLIGSNHKLLSVLFWCFCIYFCGIYFSLYFY